MEQPDSNHAELIDYLAKEGVNINQMNKHGVTPLIKAIVKGTTHFAGNLEALLKNGADVSLTFLEHYQIRKFSDFENTPAKFARPELL